MSLKSFVNNKDMWDSFLEEIDLRIEQSRLQLEQRDETFEMYRFQGEIRALKKLKKLREELKYRDKQHG